MASASRTDTKAAAATAAAKEVLLSKTWSVQHTSKSSYTGGKVCLSRDRSFVVCTNNENVSVLELESGRVRTTVVADEEESFTTFALHPSDNEITTASARSFLLKRWDLRTGKAVKSQSGAGGGSGGWKGHQMPILDLAYDGTGLLLASCSTDRTIRVWNAEKSFCTHNLKAHTAMVSRVFWHPDTNRLELVSCADNGELRIWDLRTGTSRELSSHFGLVTGAVFVDAGNTMITVGRDKVLNIWDLRSYKHVRTVPTYEVMETLTVLPSHALSGLISDRKIAVAPSAIGTLIATGGEKGEIRVWNYRAGSIECVHTHVLPQSARHAHQQTGAAAAAAADTKSSVPATETIGISRLLVAADSSRGDGDSDGGSGDGDSTSSASGSTRLIAVTTDHNFYLSNIADLTKQKLLIGFNDEIYDLRALNRSVVIATNSPQVRILDLDTSAAQLLSGHRHIVVTVDVSSDGQWIVTGSKDHTIRVWRLPAAGSAPGTEARCVAIGEGHSDAVGAVRFSRTAPSAHTFWVVSGSNDRSLKVWDIGSLLSAGADSSASSDAAPIAISPLLTAIGHEKDINAVAVAPNDRLIACGAQDRTISLWSTAPAAAAAGGAAGTELSKAGKRAARLGLTQLTTLRGHKRGVWCVEFSPVDKVLASCSGDKTIKIWSIGNFQCLRTLEGHTNTVLRVVFLRNGVQLLSSGADAVIKLWNLKTNECVNTFDTAHTEKIWAMTLLGDSAAADAKPPQLLTGGADSVLAVWSDVTSAQHQQSIADSARTVLAEQKLMNSMNRSDFGSAVALGLELRQPRRLFTVFQRLIAKEATQTADTPKPVHLKSVIGALSVVDLGQCLDYVREWNTNAKNCHIAHKVLRAILSSFGPDVIKQLPAINELLPSLLVYSERHFQRLEKLQQKSHLLDYIFQSMKVLTPMDDLQATAAATADADAEDDAAADEITALVTPVISAAAAATAAAAAAARAPAAATAAAAAVREAESEAVASSAPAANGKPAPARRLLRQSTPYPGKLLAPDTAATSAAAADTKQSDESGDDSADDAAGSSADADAAVARPPIGGSRLLNASLIDSLLATSTTTTTAPAVDVSAFAALQSNWGDDDDSGSGDDAAPAPVPAAAAPTAAPQQPAPKKLSKRKTRSETTTTATITNSKQSKKAPAAPAAAPATGKSRARPVKKTKA